ncbi:transposase [Novipirellula sp. SH528]|uniref:transposase n=1 Tax=Novipirellula sp. SH528 TaxID=3454466 RepID=UPI003FA14772
MVNRNTLQRRQELLKELIDGTYCRTDPLPKWVPPTESGRQDLASRIEAAAIVLEQRINENAKKPSDKRKDPDKITVSLTDPIAPLGRDKRKTYRPLYTVQFMVDPVSRLIVSYLCQASATDAGTLAPMIDKTQKMFGGQLKRVLADGSYCSILDLTDACDRNIDLLAPPSASGSAAKRKSRSGEIQIPREEFRFEASLNCYVCPQGHRLAYLWREKKMRMGDRYVYQSTYQCDAKFCEGCPLAERCLSGKGPRRIKRIEGEEMLEAQREKMASESCKTLYRLRGQTVELSFGDAKGNRRVDRFHGRGIERARCETGLLILAQNLLRLDKLQQRAISLGKQTA